MQNAKHTLLTLEGRVCTVMMITHQFPSHLNEIDPRSVCTYLHLKLNVLVHFHSPAVWSILKSLDKIDTSLVHIIPFRL